MPKAISNIEVWQRDGFSAYAKIWTSLRNLNNTEVNIYPLQFRHSHGYQSWSLTYSWRASLLDRRMLTFASLVRRLSWRARLSSRIGPIVRRPLICHTVAAGSTKVKQFMFVQAYATGKVEGWLTFGGEPSSFWWSSDCLSFRYAQRLPHRLVCKKHVYVKRK